MTLEVANFKETSGPGNSQDGGQTYTVFSSTDTLGVMMASGYLNDLAFKLNVRDTVVMSGADFSQLVRIDTNSGGVVTVTANLAAGSVQSITGAGAADIVTAITEVTSTSTDAITLADGAAGQVKVVSLVVDGGTMTLTPANALGYTSIAFADVGDTVTLVFLTGGWAIQGQGGLGTGPLSS